MNKILVVSIAALFTLMVFVGESQQQTTAPPEPPAPTIYEGCTCVGKPQRDRPERERREAGWFAQVVVEVVINVHNQTLANS